ncbi:MAG: redoxin family protein, partial [Burkholderiales bacterium]|nr:redoxin family protein [Burkholderiales bacterium]
ETLIIWLPSGFGQQDREGRIAADLVANGITVWEPDLLEAHFLPPLESSLAKIDAEEVAQLIEQAHDRTGKHVYLLAAGRAGLLALRGARAWQEAHPRGRTLAGVVLLHPNLFLGPPAPGNDAVYDPIVTATHLPIFIIQPALSPWRWRLATTLAQLESGGSKVFAQVLPDVRDRFYFRADATAREEVAVSHLARYVRQAIDRLAQTVLPSATSTPPAAHSKTATAVGKRGLNPYNADANPPALTLSGLDGEEYDLSQYRRRVVLVNFWATWCPPCVRELPSMQRLKKKLSDKPFAILTVNISEEEETIRAFIRDQVKVDLPILLDRDGAAMKRWKVYVFPTSFVLGPEGRIQYGAYGELTWDSETILRTIESLLPES